MQHVNGALEIPTWTSEVRLSLLDQLVPGLGAEPSPLGIPQEITLRQDLQSSNFVLTAGTRGCIVPQNPSAFLEMFTGPADASDPVVLVKWFLDTPESRQLPLFETGAPVARQVLNPRASLFLGFQAFILKMSPSRTFNGILRGVRTAYINRIFLII